MKKQKAEEEIETEAEEVDVVKVVAIEKDAALVVIEEDAMKADLEVTGVLEAMKTEKKGEDPIVRQGRDGRSPVLNPEYQIDQDGQDVKLFC